MYLCIEITFIPFLGIFQCDSLHVFDKVFLKFLLYIIDIYYLIIYFSKMGMLVETLLACLLSMYIQGY